MIEEGLKPGERVIVNGLQQVRSGMTVEPKLVDMPRRDPKSEPSKSDEPLQAVRIPITLTDREARVMLARFFIDRPVLAWAISIVIILLGAIAAALLPVAQYPEITPPTVRVTASYPGANAQVVADTVAAPIEQQVIGVEKMLYMSSQSNNDGSYTLDVTFERGHRREHGPGAGAEPRRHRPADAARHGQGHRRDRQEAVPGHPADRQSVFRRQSGHRPAVLRPALPEQLRHDPSSRMRWPGWRAWETCFSFGGQDYSMRVWLDPDKLQSRNLTASDVIRVLREQNVQVAAGQIGQPPVPHGPGLPVHHEHPRPAGRARTVRRHHPQDRRGRGGHLPQGRRPGPNWGPRIRTTP